MITELRLLDFKNFQDATLRLGPFTILTGANASGKSNIRDVVRFLHGIGRGYALADIVGGKYGAGGQSEWMPMRGGANEIVRFGTTSFTIQVKFSLSKLSDTNGPLPAEYLINVGNAKPDRSRFQVLGEEFTAGSELIYTTGSNPDEPFLRVYTSKPGPQRNFHDFPANFHDQPILSQVGELRSVARQSRDRVQAALDVFAGIRFLDLVPDQMRKPGFPGQFVLGDSGENFSTVLQEICQTPERKSILIDWIQELTPMDIVDFEFPRDPSGLIHLVLKERSGIAVSAYSASDGTLRFLALLAALLGTHPAKLYFFEEIETGIHPSRLRLLLDLIEHQTANNGIQVIATTHSPDLLQMISDSTFNHTSVVYRPRDTDHAIIRPVAELPNASRLRAEQGLGPLHASGWMEDVLFFNGENEQAAAK